MNIYLLKKNGVVIYVGRTKNVNRRLQEHKGKNFDSYELLECLDSDANELEDYYIVKHDPIHNRSLNSKGEYKKLSVFCKEELFDIKVAKQVIDETPYINPLFKDNYSPRDLSSLKSLLKHQLGVGST